MFPLKNLACKELNDKWLCHDIYHLILHEYDFNMNDIFLINIGRFDVSSMIYDETHDMKFTWKKYLLIKDGTDGNVFHWLLNCCYK